jgi:hypothetical protein
MNQKPKKKITEYSKNKKAFDSVISRLHSLGSPKLGSVGAINFDQIGGAAPHNPAAPTTVDFRCDVLMAIRDALPKGVRLAKFIQAYLLWDSGDALEQNIFSQKILGGRVHSVEQRIGAEFVRRGIWPDQAYMYPPRLKHPRTSL